jgi:hypothetical protein
MDLRSKDNKATKRMTKVKTQTKKERKIESAIAAELFDFVYFDAIKLHAMSHRLPHRAATDHGATPTRLTSVPTVVASRPPQRRCQVRGTSNDCEKINCFEHANYNTSATKPHQAARPLARPHSRTADTRQL